MSLEKLKLEGYYNYVGAPNGRGNLTGEIEIAKNGSFEGNYSGSWQTMPYKIEFNEDLNLFTAQIYWSIGIGDDAEIILSKK